MTKQDRKCNRVKPVFAAEGPNPAQADIGNREEI
jgi:hypothetical protein